MKFEVSSYNITIPLEGEYYRKVDIIDFDNEGKYEFEWLDLTKIPNTYGGCNFDYSPYRDYISFQCESFSDAEYITSKIKDYIDGLEVN